MIAKLGCKIGMQNWDANWDEMDANFDGVSKLPKFGGRPTKNLGQNGMNF